MIYFTEVNNGLLLQYGKRAGDTGSNRVILPISYVSYYSITGIVEDTNNNTPNTLKINYQDTTKTYFSGIASWSKNGTQDYTGNGWYWMTIGS